jgi:hypothetical protein
LYFSVSGSWVFFVVVVKLTSFNRAFVGEVQTSGCFLTGVFLVEGFYRTMWLGEIYGL